MDAAKLSIVLVILLFTVGGYVLSSIILFVWPNLWHTKRKTDEEETDFDNNSFFERAVNDGQNVLEYDVVVSENSVVIHCEENKEEGTTTPPLLTAPPVPIEDGENKVNLEDVFLLSKEAPTIISVNTLNEELSSMIYFITKHKREKLILLGSASTKIRHALYQMDSPLPVYKRADWKLYACYFTGFLPFVSHDNSILIITHCFRPKINEEGNVTWFTKLRQRMSNMRLCCLGPMINHLKKKGIKTYLISINWKDGDKLPANHSLRINEKPKRFTRDLLCKDDTQAFDSPEFIVSTNVDTAESEAIGTKSLHFKDNHFASKTNKVKSSGVVPVSPIPTSQQYGPTMKNSPGASSVVSNDSCSIIIPDHSVSHEDHKSNPSKPYSGVQEITRAEKDGIDRDEHGSEPLLKNKSAVDTVPECEEKPPKKSLKERFGIKSKSNRKPSNDLNKQVHGRGSHEHTETHRLVKGLDDGRKLMISNESAVSTDKRKPANVTGSSAENKPVVTNCPTEESKTVPKTYSASESYSTDVDNPKAVKDKAVSTAQPTRQVSTASDKRARSSHQNEYSKEDDQFSKEGDQAKPSNEDVLKNMSVVDTVPECEEKPPKKSLKGRFGIKSKSNRKPSNDLNKQVHGRGSHEHTETHRLVKGLDDGRKLMISNESAVSTDKRNPANVTGSSAEKKPVVTNCPTEESKTVPKTYSALESCSTDVDNPKAVKDKAVSTAQPTRQVSTASDKRARSSHQNEYSKEDDQFSKEGDQAKPSNEDVLKNMSVVDTVPECEEKPPKKSLKERFGIKSKSNRKPSNDLNKQVHGRGSHEHTETHRLVKGLDDGRKLMISNESAVSTDKRNPANVTGSSAENKPVVTNCPTEESKTVPKTYSASESYSTDVDNPKAAKDKAVSTAQPTRHVSTASDKRARSSHQNEYSKEDDQFSKEGDQAKPSNEDVLKNMSVVDTVPECEEKPPKKSLKEHFGIKSKSNRKPSNDLNKQVHGRGSHEHTETHRLVKGLDDGRKLMISNESAVSTDKRNPANVTGSSAENKPVVTNCPTEESKTVPKTYSASESYSTDVDNPKAVKDKAVSPAQLTRQVSTASDKRARSSHQNEYSKEDDQFSKEGDQAKPSNEDVLKNMSVVDTVPECEEKPPKKSLKGRFGIKSKSNRKPSNDLNKQVHGRGSHEHTETHRLVKGLDDGRKLMISNESAVSTDKRNPANVTGSSAENKPVVTNCPTEESKTVPKTYSASESCSTDVDNPKAVKDKAVSTAQPTRQVSTASDKRAYSSHQNEYSKEDDQFSKEGDQAKPSNEDALKNKSVVDTVPECEEKPPKKSFFSSLWN